MTTTTTTTTTGVPGATPRACLAIAAVALALRLGLALRDVVALDRMFVPDDTYYTLTIARSIARGLGPTVDGTHLTSGFQPLLAFLLAPVLKLGATPEGGFRAALALGGVADSASAWLLGFLAYRIGRGSKVAAILATTLWALSPSAIATSLNGLETSLAVASVLAALAAWTALRERDRPLGWLGCGMLLGLALFARVDTVFFVALVGLATLRTGGAAGLRRAAIAAGGALVVVGPWWAYSLARFGTIVPESGAAVREQTRMYAAMGMVLRDQLAWAAGAVVGPPLFDSTWLRQALGSGASGVGCAIAVVLVAGAFVLAALPNSPKKLMT